MIAVLGGDAIRSLGYGYVLYPILFCVGAMLVAALCFRVATSPRTALVVREKVRRRWSDRPPL